MRQCLTFWIIDIQKPHICEIASTKPFAMYFDIKIEYTDISPEEFKQKMQNYETNLADYFKESRQLEEQIFTHLKDIKYDK